MDTGAPYTQQFAATAAAATQLLGCQDYRLAYQRPATGSPVPGLTAAYRLAQAAQAPAVPLEVILLEASGRLGGTIATHMQDGLLLEQGPDCFLSAKPWGVRLCEELGLGDELIGTTTQYRQSFIVRG